MALNSRRVAGNSRMMRARFLPAAIIAVLSGLFASAPASAAIGDLTQKTGTDACVSDTGTAGACEDGANLDGAFALAVSPDSRNVYVATENGIAVFDRDPGTGALEQKAGADGCISPTGSGGSCATGVAVDAGTTIASSTPEEGSSAITVSPDGANVYLAASDSNSIAVFRRAPLTGTLTQLSGTAGCVSATGSGGSCATGRGLTNPTGVTVSPDGRFTYVASLSGSIAIFARDAFTGALTQLAGTAGCVTATGAAGCAAAPSGSIRNPTEIAIPADGEFAYVTSSSQEVLSSGGLVTFDRDVATGGLTYVTCIGSNFPPCLPPGRGILDLTSVALSPDGANTYTASNPGGFAAYNGGVASFDRSAAGGAVTQKPGVAGCVTNNGFGGQFGSPAGACADGRGLNGSHAVAVAPDGMNVYEVGEARTVSFPGYNLDVLDRATATGILTQKSGTAGCYSNVTAESPPCGTATALDGAFDVVVSPDGDSVYVAAVFADSIGVFDREDIDPPQCSDGLDNDSDAKIDFPADPGCLSAADSSEATDSNPQCSDELDNDGDTKVDYPADPGCLSAADTSEATDSNPQCSDDLDNDGDGKVDFGTGASNDPGCLSAADSSESTDSNPQCSDELDNDSDAKTDFPADPGCLSAADNSEATDSNPQCSDELDNDSDAKIDFPADPGCLSAADNSEATDSNPQCSDELDNDGDTKVDYPADPGCSSASDTTEDSDASTARDAVVADLNAFGGSGGVIRINGTTGARTTVSRNTSPQGGPSFVDPVALVFNPAGQLLVADRDAFGGPGGVVRVNPATGARATVSSNTTPAGGPRFSNPTSLAVEPSGSIVVADADAFGGPGGLIRVNSTTGARTTISSNSTPSGSVSFEEPTSVTRDGAGNLIVADRDAYRGSGAVIRVNPTTGVRTVISRNEAPSGGPSFADPTDVTLEANGNILVADSGAFGGTGGVIRVNPTTGVRTVLSRNGSPAGGPAFANPVSLVVDSTGTAFVSDMSAFGGSGGVLRVNSLSGARTTLSSNSSPPGSTSFVDPAGIALVPLP